MTRIWMAAIAVAAAIASTAGTSLAEGSRQVGIAIFGGYGTYSMSDVNDAITNPGTLFPGTSVTADEINGGASFGGGLRFKRSDQVTLALDVSQLLAKTTGTAVFLGTPYDGELSLPATSVTLTVHYLFHAVSSSRLGIGLGAGYYACTGELKATSGGFSDSADAEGSGFGLHALGVGDIPLSKTVHVEMGAGYRYAKTTDITFDGGVLRNSDGSKSKVDWSGFTGRIGATFYLGDAPEAPKSE